MEKIIFKDTKEFYKLLDKKVKNDDSVIIIFNDNSDRLNEKSPLWKRLKRTKNWKDFQSELKDFSIKKPSANTEVFKKIFSPSLQRALTGGEIFLVAFIATLIAGITIYAIYKERDVKIRFNKDEEVEIEID